MPKPGKRRKGVSQLLIATALDADLRRRLLESPEELFPEYDLTEAEKDLLRQPDQRLLRLFGAALAEEAPAVVAAHARPEATPTIATARTLPGISLALTLVPCAQYQDGQLSKIAYAVWVNPMAEGADPTSLPIPQGATLPGQPLTPLHAVIQVSAVQMQGLDGQLQVGLTASLRQSSNVTAPAPPESDGRPESPPFGSDLASAKVQAAVAAVRNAGSGDRYAKLLDLIHALHSGEVR